MKNKNNNLLILSLLGITWIISCNQPKGNVELEENNVQDSVITLTEEQIQNTGMEIGKITYRELPYTLKLNGKIELPPQNLVSISVPMGGFLKHTPLLNGMKVKKGEPIAVLEDMQYIQIQQDYLTARAQLSFLENEYQRQKALNESKATSDKLYEQAMANYQTQKVTVKALEEKLKLLGIEPKQLTSENLSKSVTLYSPINGYVANVYSNVGKYISSGQVLFELIDPADIHLSLTVFDKDLDKLQVGQKVYAYTNSHPEKKYPCEIILISKKVSEQNSAEVHCHFLDYQDNLLPGLFMNAEIEISGSKIATLPEEAILFYKNQHYVILKKGKNQFVMQPIQVGNRAGGNIAILNSKDIENQEVVVKGAYRLLKE